MTENYETRGRVKLEICTGEPYGIRMAESGKGDRIELCSGLAEGGLTPSYGIMEYACKGKLPVNVLIRPRPGDFIYDPFEVEVMERDIELAAKCGANGIVTGALTEDGEVNIPVCRRLLEKCSHLDNTFHRAFDLVKDPFKALEEIIDLGFKRILTSGQAADALSGASLISELHKAAGGRIIIMAGAGVTPENVRRIIEQSCADEIHASARSIVRSKMNYSGQASMGSADGADGSRLSTDCDKILQLHNILRYQ